MSAGELKDKGNAEFKVGNYDAAIGHFSSAIKLEPSHVLYSNRSACNCGLRKYDDALKDAESCIGLKGDWGKGYGRKGAALHGMGRFDDAVAAYEAGLKVEPGLAMLVKGRDDAKAQAQRGGGGGGGGGGMEDQLGTLFSRPDLLWWRPMHPWCSWPFRTHALTCDAPGCDAAWVAPRAYLERLFNQVSLHRDCASVGHRRTRDFTKRGICCGSSEYLLCALPQIEHSRAAVHSSSPRLALLRVG